VGLGADNAVGPRRRVAVLDLGREEVGIDAFHHLVYAGAMDAAYARLDR
jgi:hypothetical protein